MLREALKTALLDLKGQMRGRRASSYLGAKAEPKHEKKEKHEKDEDEGDVDVVDAVLGGGEGDGEKGKAPAVAGKGLDPDLKAEMSQFMSKRRKGSTKGGPSKSVFASMEAPKPKALKGKK